MTQVRKPGDNPRFDFLNILPITQATWFYSCAGP